MKHTLSLCMIVKDEEKNLPTCLDSVKDLVDEIIVVDTGSKDKTVEIARNYGAKVEYFEWCNDFSSARNEALKYATKDWILVMDADEYIDEQNKEKLKELLKNPTNNAYYINIKNLLSREARIFSVRPFVKLHRNIKGIYYIGEIHNQIDPSLHKLGITPEATSIFIYHTGDLLSPEDAKKKSQRGLKILKEWCAKEPDNPLPYFYIAGKYEMIEQYDLVLQYLYKVMNLLAPPELHLVSCSAIVNCLNKLEKYDESINVCKTAYTVYPDEPIFHIHAGEALRIKGLHNDAIKELKIALELSQRVLNSKHSVLHLEICPSVICKLLSKNYSALGDNDNAGLYYRKAIELNQNYTMPYRFR